MNILLLQGPLGTFFQQLSGQLLSQRHHVVKVHFNGGDAGYKCHGTNLYYQGNASDWNQTLEGYIKKYHIDCVICYGDCRYYHKVANQICQQQAVDFWVLEEGYFRQGYITLEKGGANAYSPLYKDRQQLPLMDWISAYPEHQINEKTFLSRALSASYYHIRRSLLAYQYPDYQNHRPWGAVKEGYSWLKGGLIKYGYKIKDAKLLTKLEQKKVPLFLLPLQVSKDFQIIEHSSFDNLEQVIEKVIKSFVTFAPSDAELLIKHHPQDRGFTNYKHHIESLIKHYKLEGRVHYGYNLPLPKIYPLLKGTITVNSTVGISSLIHSVPTICLGKALYDVPNVTSQQSLDDFWIAPSPVSDKVFERLKQSLLHLTQIKGDFYTGGDQTALNIIDRIVSERKTKLEGISKVSGIN